MPIRIGPWQLYQTVFENLLKSCQALAAIKKRRFRFKHPLRSLDTSITIMEQVVGPKTEEDAVKASEYRKIAIQALKDGIASKKRITR